MDRLIHGNILGSLIKFTLPILFALLLQTTYGMVDLLIVGHFGMVADVSGVATGSQLMTLLTSICNGLAMGTTVLIGREIGLNRLDNIGKIVKSTVLVFAVLAFVSLVGILIFIDQIVNLLNTPLDALSQTRAYLFICTLGIPMIYAYNVLGSIFRGFGDSKTPLFAVGIACAANIILDLILVAVLNLGSAGAALATVFSQFLSVLISIWLIKAKKMLNFAPDHKQQNNPDMPTTDYGKQILRLGLPIAVQSGLVGLSFLAITAIVNQFGLIFSAGVGLVEKLTGLIMLVPISFMNSLAVFVAQNYAANQIKRARHGLLISFIISFGFSLVMAYLSFFHGSLLTALFTNDSLVIAASATYLQAYAIDTLLVPLIFCLSGYFTGCGKTFFVMAQGLFGALALRIPLTYLFSLIEPVSLFNIGLAIPLATLVQIIICLVYFGINNKKGLI